MAGVAKVAIILFLAAVAAQVNSDVQGQHGGCELSDIEVTQEKTGKVVLGQPEYRVTIENLCSCPQDDVQLHCNRLPSVESVNSRKIKVEDQLCKVTSGLFNGSPVTFTYAWQIPQEFTVVSAVSSC
ncbi:hypothetical protein QOZ80_9BG0708400 [Eleusine coracana subsp. coracana]|nr:hypothetical protein QOZ80_9BG0708400 [Eleusine coracana subsp. coracana]